MDSLLIIGKNSEPSFRYHFKEHGYNVEYYHPLDTENLTISADICLLDLRNCQEIDWPLRIVQQSQPQVLFLILAEPEQLNNPDVVSLITQFAWDYHTAPIEIERLSLVVGHMMGIARLKRQSQILPLRSQLSNCFSIMQQVKEQIECIAPTNIPVLVRGESGTGKERIAFQLHACSARKEGPFIAVNCGAIAPGLAQSDLFGHEKGAFTGAGGARKGKIAQANGGTLFLDEIGDLPMDQQANLLRFLQEGKFDVVGGSQVCESDVRIVAATHVDLDLAIEEGKFRLDLFYRLNGITLNIPSLRERREEILPLADQFVQQYVDEFKLSERRLSRDAKQALLSHEWPGNVREMINCIRRAVLLSKGPCVNAQDLDLSLLGLEGEAPASLKVQRNNAERAALEGAIKDANGKVERVANKLQISRATLYRLIEKHRLPLAD
jgi:DNA-binding NtrC family response regulator